MSITRALLITARRTDMGMLKPQASRAIENLAGFQHLARALSPGEARAGRRRCTPPAQPGESAPLPGGTRALCPPRRVARPHPSLGRRPDAGLSSLRGGARRSSEEFRPPVSPSRRATARAPPPSRWPRPPVRAATAGEGRSRSGYSARQRPLRAHRKGLYVSVGPRANKKTKRGDPSRSRPLYVSCDLAVLPWRLLHFEVASGRSVRGMAVPRIEQVRCWLHRLALATTLAHWRRAPPEVLGNFGRGAFFCAKSHLPHIYTCRTYECIQTNLVHLSRTTKPQAMPYTWPLNKVDLDAGGAYGRQDGLEGACVGARDGQPRP